MKTTELRIGNMLYCRNTVDVAIVELIHKKHFDCRDDYGMFTPNGKYEPIPLTEEWLLKLGFEKDEYNNQKAYYYTFNGFKLNVINGSLVIDNPNQLASAKNIKIEHVHQLQNLYFALTGEELEVKP